MIWEDKLAGKRQARWWHLSAAALLLALTPATVGAQTEWRALNEPATTAHPAEHPFLLAGAMAGDRLLTAGERGGIFLSDDAGASWRQAKVPVNVTLTEIAFADAVNGWAIGHFGVILRSTDGGKNWLRQMDGVTIAGLYAKEVERLAAAGQDPSGANATFARYLAEDGPDKPLLDILITDADRALVIGAYGLALKTENGGTDWTPLLASIDNPGKLHLNSLTRAKTGDALFMVGEQGTIYRSTDNAESFQALSSPYEGSFFTVVAPTSANVIVGGLRGNAFESRDGGESWEKLDLPGAASITASLITSDGSVWLADQGGGMFTRPAGANSFSPVTLPMRLPITGLLEGANKMLTLLGPAGAIPVPFSSAGK